MNLILDVYTNSNQLVPSQIAIESEDLDELFQQARLMFDALKSESKPVKHLPVGLIFNYDIRFDFVDENEQPLEDEELNHWEYMDCKVYQNVIVIEFEHRDDGTTMFAEYYLSSGKGE
ncbi:hypothetical protein [Shewanella aestuarii]|uniref:Uncharacterized protein n=1 Tax=Shewanella aestuarii TaxID=1028752 RepID=A0A6G9QS55_9GAMM|nr:hypothetical protein [Shewanella aestuarii]QIR16611.1 hypothetical protein HBH39_19235 [Shewanella aestuarii]